MSSKEMVQILKKGILKIVWRSQKLAWILKVLQSHENLEKSQKSKNNLWKIWELFKILNLERYFCIDLLLVLKLQLKSEFFTKIRKVWERGEHSFSLVTSEDFMPFAYYEKLIAPF